MHTFCSEDQSVALTRQISLNDFSFREKKKKLNGKLRKLQSGNVQGANSLRAWDSKSHFNISELISELIIKTETFLGYR